MAAIFLQFLLVHSFLPREKQPHSYDKTYFRFAADVRPAVFSEKRTATLVEVGASGDGIIGGELL